MGEHCQVPNCPLEDKLDDILAKIERIEHAFPDGVDNHRTAHEAMIRAAKAEERFWSELKLDIAKKGVWGLLVIIVGLLLVGASVKLGLGAPR